ncbi:MAG: hypothetical protein AAFR51_09325 [Pseudomonadota bacterium]
MRRITFFSSFSTLALGAALWSSASAQTPDEMIATCAAETDLTERIDCLERALRGDAVAAVASVEPAAAVAAVAVVEAPEELGADQVAARTGSVEIDENRQTFQVASTRLTPRQKLEITLGNGQVWRQIGGDSRVIRISKVYKDSLTADIWNARFSGYKMRLNEVKKTIRVERLK